MRIYSFDPIADENCKVLILGTMPGVMSLKKQQYYGFERNAFWRIIYAVFGREPDEDYELRKAFLLEHRIALWDVLKACEREGSSDSEIRNPEPNDFESFFRRCKGIRYVCFNGGPARRLYERFVRKKGTGSHITQYFDLPSTSPAYVLAFEKKLEKWMLLKELAGDD
ncbi:MAG TPA: DNA-deoxyinosine glycosylase [Clostridiales bacterium]|nr:DNA-deoxyinosine glycosylase [Clostridiales bacterium]